MALFPFFADIEGARVLIIGKGTHAREKIERLKPFGPELQLVVPEEFEERLLTPPPAFVIVAGHEQEENRKIAGLCKARNIPVNVVDDQPVCDFVFPSLISRGKLTVGICTAGASPSTGVLLKRKFEAQIPENLEEILDFLQEVRSIIQTEIPDKKQRYAFYYRLSEYCMEQNRPLTKEEFARWIKEERSHVL